MPTVSHPTQGNGTQSSLQCGTEGLSPETLIPQTVCSEKQQLKWYYKNRSFLTIDVPGITAQMEQMYAGSLQNNALSESGNGRDMRGTWRMVGEINA